MRDTDGQADAGIYVGETAWSPEYGFMVYQNIRYIPGEEAWRSTDEIKLLRALR